MADYTIRQGDTLARIAAAHQLASWKKIYQHPNNADFRQKRPNPDLIYPGDLIYVPDREDRHESGDTDRRHSYVYKKPKQVLRIAAEDMDGKRLRDQRYQLWIDGELSMGTTDGDGAIEKEISVLSAQGKLRIGDYQWELDIGHLNPMDENTPDQGLSGAQGRLLNLGYPVGPVDGIYGPKTQTALRYFQADEHLPETGQLDSATRAKLIAVHGV
jgi:N-acetylmuramoyl-L-alanine amidase